MGDDGWVGPAQVSLDRSRRPEEQTPPSPFQADPVRPDTIAPPPSGRGASLDPFAGPKAPEASKRPTLPHAELSYLKDRTSWAWKAPLAAIVIANLFRLIPAPDLPWPAWWITVMVALGVINLLLLARGLYALVRGFLDCRRCGFKPLAGHLIVGLLFNLPLIGLFGWAIWEVAHRQLG